MNLEQLSAVELGLLFGVSSRAVQQMAEQGMPFEQLKSKVYRFHWRHCLHWWIANRYKGSVRQDRGVPSKAESEAKLLAIKTEREAMKLARESGELLPLEEVEPAWMRVAETVKTRVLAIPPKAKEVLPHLTGEDIKALATLAIEALEELSKCPSVD